MASAQLPISSLPLWQTFNSVVFHNNIRIANISGKGYGLVAERGNLAAAGGGNDGPITLIKVPHHLVLHAEAVEEYAKQDRNFRLLLDAVGHQTQRGDVLLFLLVQLVLGLKRADEALAALPTPWTEYVKFLPNDVPLPSLWTDAERLLLQGTSLEAAVEAKLVTLEHEFDQLRERSSDIPFWQAAFWERESSPNLRHWFLVDAWYRSRCLELPRSGPAMVPCIDMVNHSITPNAYYEENGTTGSLGSGEVALLLRPQHHLDPGEEITISYTGSSGDDDAAKNSSAKPAAEMLFSYGFVDPQSTCQSLTLPFRPFPDDPLAKAKLHVFGGPAPRLEIERLSGSTSGGDAEDNGNEDSGNNGRATESVRWTCPFAYLMCVNEEDGLDFRLRQETDGTTQLRLFWQDADVTDSARDFASLTKVHELAPVFQLRVVTVLQEVMETHLERMQAAGEDEAAREIEDTDMVDDAGTSNGPANGSAIRSDVAKQAALLRDIESRILTSALESLEAERSSLLTDATVVAYLGSMEVAENELAEGEAPNQEEADQPIHEDDDDDDFS